jgi:hypothetical protein
MTSRCPAFTPNVRGLRGRVEVKASVPALADSSRCRRLDAAGNIAFQWFVLCVALHENKRYE